ncbi:MAG: hypothetical protein OH339_01860 [Candidatus Parvarchaeota archaeon]|nr:hypothetical protein [Candidatus Haiyanarchaeum thermophilum]
MRGFVKMVEVTISMIVLLFIFFQMIVPIMQQQSREDLIFIQTLCSYLKTVSQTQAMKEVYRNYGFSQLDFMFSKLAEVANLQLELEYTLYNVMIINPTNITLEDELAAFTYHFPRGINKNSIRVGDSEFGDFQLWVGDNWFRIPITIQTSEEWEELNLTLDNLFLTTFGNGEINNRSIQFYLGGEKMRVEVRDFISQAGGTSAIVNLTVNLKKLGKGSFKAYVYYSNNNSISKIFPEFYYELAESQATVTKLIGTAERTSTYDLIIKVPRVMPFERKILYLKFKVGGAEVRSFPYIEFTGSNLAVNLLENELKDGGEFIISRPIRGKAYMCMESIGFERGIVAIKLYGSRR